MVKLAITAMAGSVVSIDERVRARAALLERRAQQDLGLWIELRTPEYRAPRHLGELLDIWDRIQSGESIFALIEAPPRHAKSETMFHGAARLLKARPSTRIIYGTYNADFAIDQSRKLRDIAVRAGVWLSEQQQHARGRFDPAAAARYWQTAQGGGVIAVGRGGGVTGRGGDLILIDDPYKDREEAESPLIRERVSTWFGSTLFTRREPGASIIVCHQRWNDEDLIGELSQTGQTGRYERMTFPARKEDGSPLWPERYDDAELRLIEDTLDEYDWWSQYMQSPRPRGKSIFGDPARYDEAQRQRVRLVLGVDCANAATAKADYNALVLLAVTGAGATMEAWVLRVWRFHGETPAMVDELETLYRAGVPSEGIAPLKGVPFVIETQGGEGRAVVQMLKRIVPNLPIVEVTTTKNKLLRAQAVATAWNKERVHCPLQAPWLEEFLLECRRFTGLGGQKDDQVDALAHAWNYAATMLENIAGKTGGEREMARSQF